MTDFFNEQKEEEQLLELEKESNHLFIKGGIGCLIPIILFILFIFSVFDSLFTSDIVIICVIGLVCGIYGFVCIRKSSNVLDKVIDIEKNKKMRNINAEKSELVKKYGKISKEICLNKDEYNIDIKEFIFVFEESCVVWILGNDFLCGDILHVTCNDNQTIKHGEATANTKTKTGNMVARTVVGSAVMGVPGAIIGGATAKQKTIINQEDDTIMHDYTIVVNVDSLSNSIVYIHVGDDEHLMNEILGLFQVIIRRYQNKNKSDESSMR